MTVLLHSFETRMIIYKQNDDAGTECIYDGESGGVLSGYYIDED